MAHKMVIIDTVVSGRASWTILDELKKIEGLEKIVPVLIVDDDGHKLKKRFRSFVDTKGGIKIPRIFTEDMGASLEGVLAVIYPGLIIAGEEGRLCDYHCYPLFGSWHSLPKDSSHQQTFEVLVGTLKDLIAG